ncbi:hypothetical protein [Coralloluteibacterium thermophilus]|uniref:Poly(3-hydroxybutyrate) depolymerase n=1 Tax=Coralloluteibacterium thermophilum TaxID=2707049 RepID=A0ABV9NHE9_9GAMM
MDSSGTRGRARDPHRAAARVLAVAAGAVLAACAAPAPDAQPLPALGVDAQRVVLVGLSSGAAFATQAHLAHPERFVGVGLVAGPPYGCAGGDLQVALGSCMKGEPAPDAEALVADIRARAADGRIGPLEGLAGDRVWVLRGSADPVVGEAVVDATVAVYRALAEDAPGLEVRYDGGRAFGHLLPTDGDAGVACGETASPFLGACGFDAAGAALDALLGPAPGAPPAQAQGELLAFDQDALRPGGADAFLADTGYVYVPAQCRERDCGVVVALHGCDQNAGAVGEAFVRDAGFNRQADARDLVVLYPQTRASYAPLNPKACWDWWGYSGTDYDTRDGVQLRWLSAALDALARPR